jgi:RNA polymerase subunit RPABC4/transcription elongation factor Spt4
MSDTETTNQPTEERCPVCGGPTETGTWTGATLCRDYGSEHYRRERTDPTPQ